MAFEKITDSQEGRFGIAQDTVLQEGEASALLKVTDFSAFAPVVTKVVDEDTETETYSATFSQGYLINYLDLNKRNPPYFIRNMDKSFELEDGGDGDPVESVFEVSVVLHENSGEIEEVYFQRRPRIGEEGYRGEIEPDVYNINTTFPVPTCLEVFIPVCRFENRTLTDWWLKSDIQWWGDLKSSCKPFSPSIINEAPPEAEPIYKFLIGFGTINNVLVNQTPLPYTTPEIKQYIIATVDVAGAIFPSISLQNEDGLASLDLNPVQVDSPASFIDVILGTIHNGRVCMNYHSNINIVSELYFQEPVEGEISLGASPFVNYYRLKVEQDG